MDKEILRKILREELEPMMTKLNETYDIVRALEHKSEVNKSEHDKMQKDITHIQGDLTHAKMTLSL